MPADLKSEIEEAAALVGATFTSFATEILVEKARQIKRDHGLIVLNNQDRDAFLKVLVNPPEPSEELIKVMKTQVTL
jgi:uncharacterized protein (DUF1778 family)